MFKRTALALAINLCIAAPLLAGSHQDAARELMQVSGTEQIMAQMQLQIESMFLNISSDAQYTAEQQQIVERYRAEVAEILAGEMQWEKIEDNVVELYTQSFNEQELRELITFYTTPLGQKMITKMPEVMLRSAEISRRQMRFVIPRIKQLGQAMSEELRTSN